MLFFDLTVKLLLIDVKFPSSLTVPNACSGYLDIVGGGQTRPLCIGISGGISPGSVGKSTTEESVANYTCRPNSTGFCTLFILVLHQHCFSWIFTALGASQRSLHRTSLSPSIRQLAYANPREDCTHIKMNQLRWFVTFCCHELVPFIPLEETIDTNNNEFFDVSPKKTSLHWACWRLAIARKSAGFSKLCCCCSQVI